VSEKRAKRALCIYCDHNASGNRMPQPLQFFLFLAICVKREIQKKIQKGEAVCPRVRASLKLD